MTQSSALEAALQNTDTAKFDKAADAARGLGDLLPTALYAALARAVAISGREGRQALDVYLKSRAAACGLRRVFATWDKAHGDEWLGGLFIREGNGIARTSETGIELVTIGHQAMSLRHTGLPQEGEFVIHFLASFPGNVGNNFYLMLEGEAIAEAVRFSNGGVALTGGNATLDCNASVLKLYTLHLTDSTTRLYVNGVLGISKPRTGGRHFQDLVIRMVGDSGADLGGVVHGIEVLYAPHLKGTLFGDDERLFQARLEALIRRSSANEVYQLLSRIDDDWSHNSDTELLGLLDKLFINRGVQEWVFDAILNRVSPRQATQWIAHHRGSLPTPVLSVRNLSCQFMRMPNNRFAISSLIKQKGRERFMVLDDIHFDVFPGDIVGIIGINGAGKSTLLKAIAGLLPIHTGEIVLRAHHLLLSAGLGARNELTGRENVYLSGTFMGLAKPTIDKLFDEIWEFSELGEAMDKPFKYYSDGMKGRLIFSLATSVSPDLLMLDELLGAGDIKFQKKAAERMDQLIERSKSVIVVTHSLPFVAQRCNKALLISGGRLKAYGDPQQVISCYLNELHLGGADPATDFNSVETTLQTAQSFGFDAGAGMK